jgi:hypothetical protein
MIRLLTHGEDLTVEGFAWPGKGIGIAKMPMIITRTISAIIKPDGSRNSILINEALILSIEIRQTLIHRCFKQNSAEAPSFYKKLAVDPALLFPQCLFDRYLLRHCKASSHLQIYVCTIQAKMLNQPITFCNMIVLYYFSSHISTLSKSSVPSYQ